MQRKQRKKVIVSHPNRVIFLLVGAAKSGKTTLMIEMAETLRDRVEIIRSVTTRPPRTDEKDHLSYDFISEKEYRIKRDRREFVECPPRHEGNFYALEKKTVDDVLKRKHGICVVMEHGVLDLEKARYRVVPINIISIGNEKMRREFYDLHPKREEADRKRSMVKINYSLVLFNRFTQGGFLEAVTTLTTFIKKFHWV